jgi:hypothetical protein
MSSQGHPPSSELHSDLQQEQGENDCSATEREDRYHKRNLPNSTGFESPICLTIFDVFLYHVHHA